MPGVKANASSIFSILLGGKCQGFGLGKSGMAGSGFVEGKDGDSGAGEMRRRGRDGGYDEGREGCDGSGWGLEVD